MIGDLKPYADYKDSSQDWLGSIPAHWGLFRAKRLFREVDERSKTGEEELLSVSHLTGVTPRRLKNVTMFMAESNVGHKVCRPGDLVINTLWAWMAALGVTRHTGLVSPAYGVYRPIDGGGMLPDYADYLLRTPLYAAEYQRRSTGVNSSRLRLYPEQFLRMTVLLPPPDEQVAIVRFLAWANGRLDRTIRAKRKVIAHLLEQKQAIIHDAVSRGLSDAVERTESGIAGVDRMPAHWDAWPFTRCAIERADYRGATPEKVESGVFLVTAKNVRPGWIDYQASQEYVRATDYAKIMRRGLPRIGDVLLTMEAPLGHVALIDREDIALAQRVIRLRLHPDRLQSSFALLCLNSPYFQNQLRMRATGSTAQGIKASKLPQLLVALPPINEQSEIVEQVRIRCAPLENFISRMEREIDLLREYRTRLVADVVTGQLDVLEAAIRLPKEEVTAIEADPADEVDDPELIDEEAAEA